MPAPVDDPLPAPDPNLLCSICLNVFSHPVRTACGHVFCQSCLQSWLGQKAQCPECRAPVVDAARDRSAERLASNVESHCQFRSRGCGWTGRRGDMAGHLATDCPAVTICCPNQNCGCEVARSQLPAHLQTCTAAATPRATAEQTECPWGCGLLCANADLEQHKADCLMEPRKLLAAIHKLHAENVRLDAENMQLRMSGGPASDSRKRPCVVQGGSDADASSMDLGCS